MLVYFFISGYAYTIYNMKLVKHIYMQGGIKETNKFYKARIKVNNLKEVGA